MKIELHIERLLLEGVERRDRRAIGTALERELGRLISDRGLPPAMRTGRELSTIDAGPLDRSRSATGADTGARIARSVYRGMRS